MSDKYEKYEEKTFAVTAPKAGETVYPYIDRVKAYLLAGEELSGNIDISTGNYVRISDYWEQYSIDSVKPIEIKWQNDYNDISSYTVSYAAKEDFSDAKYVHAEADENSVELYNLYKATDYYVKVIANIKDGSIRTAESTFKTADLGPRVMHLDGSYNTRDLGGYMTSLGKRTLQGLIYRSGQMDDVYSTSFADYDTGLTELGKQTAQKELGIITDLDFRLPTYPAAFPGAVHVYVGVEGYNLASVENQKKIREVFSVFSDINNYPLIFHCQGGADRTGTIAYLFNALLGVKELDLVRDYEFTAFSIYGIRAIDHEAYMAKKDYKFYTTLAAQKGKNLQERVENYLLGTGVTAGEIANIKSIMFTGKADKNA